MGYKTRIIETPYMIREYAYKRTVRNGYKIEQRDYEKSLEGKKSDISIKRAKEKLALTIQCNVQPYSKFITFTTKENITDRKQFLAKWNNFRKKFKHKYGYNIKYSAVTETQKRGAWHLHVIAYNLTHKLNLKELTALWTKNSKNSVDVKVVDKHKNLFKYMVKYLTKEELKLNKMAVLNSKSLKQPNVMEVADRTELEQVYGRPDYHNSWSLYHGNYELDKFEDKISKEKMNECQMNEWHR